MRRTYLLASGRLTGLVVLVPLLLSACSDGGETTNVEDRPLPSVVVEAVTAKDVAGQTEFVGRTEAFQRVDVRARVSGTLMKRPFEEGAEVEKGAVLFEIDPAEFQANLLAAEAQLDKAQASLNENDRNLKRYEVLLQKEAASEAQYDIAKSKADQSRADVAAAQADVERAKLDSAMRRSSRPSPDAPASRMWSRQHHRAG